MYIQKRSKNEIEKYAEINHKILSELKSDLKVQTFFIVILIAVSIILCFYCKRLKTDNKSLEQEKQALKKYIELENERGNKNE